MSVGASAVIPKQVKQTIHCNIFTVTNDTN